MNPFTKAKVVGQTEPGEYHHPSNWKRGEEQFVMSRSELFQFARNPKKWLLGAKDEDTKSTEWGSLMDCVVTDPGILARRYVTHPTTYPARSTGIAKPWTRKADYCVEWETEREGQGLTVISEVERIEANAALERLLEDDEIHSIRKTCKFQQMAMACYHDKETGLNVNVKMLADIVPANEKALIDYKTARSADPSQWMNEVFRYGLHWQAGMYLDIWEAATGDDRPEFWHIVQENEAPYVFEKMRLSSEFVELGRAGYRAALAKYCLCLASGKWPGYRIPLEFMVDNGWIYVGPNPKMQIIQAEHPTHVKKVEPQPDFDDVTP